MTLDSCAFAAGAALYALHGSACDPQPLGLLWRQRLALMQAAAITKLQGRHEDASDLRDALILRRPHDDPGPAGRVLQAWRALADPLAADPENWLALLAPLQLKLEPHWPPLLEAAKTLILAPSPPIAAAAQIAAIAMQQRPDAPALALWLADAVLAKKLGFWIAPVPLLAAAVSRKALYGSPKHLHGDNGLWLQSCYHAYARAGERSVDLYADLARRATRLLAVAQQLRAKDASATIAKFLSQDALAPSDAAHVRSERSGRRLCERLLALGVVRELTGRSTFRLYGL
ncbi:MAG: DUF1403 family protein [Hyphomicrobiales bacterium]|nr:DUF1403 family protein [Hyphomicrobiales bacterium]MDE2114283.1 DUF1403 family protein [Hyphomicrobiales bacterium]